MKIGSIVIRCYEFDKMRSFWQEALHYVPREPAKTGGSCCAIPRAWDPMCHWTQVAEKRIGKRSRLHLDLYTSERGKSSG
jgi:hypothetical protein